MVTENSTPEANGNGTENQTSAAPADPVAEAAEKLKEAERKYLYLYADFENFRKRMERERLDFLKFGHEGFLRELLSVVDNFERAVEHGKSMNPEKGSPLAQMAQGVDMILFQLKESLRAQGVTEVTSVGQKFDPALHEALSEEAVDKAEPGTILREMVKGYTLHGRLLRAAKVVTARKP